MGDTPAFSATLDTIDRTVDRFARDYPSAPPTFLIAKVQERLRQLRQLLNGKLTLAQHRHLLVASGWLAALLSNLQFDIGHHHAAQASRDVAYQLGNEAGDQHLVAWTFEFLARFALVDGQLRDSVDFSRAGFHIAPPHLGRRTTRRPGGLRMGAYRRPGRGRGRLAQRGRRTGRPPRAHPS